MKVDEELLDHLAKLSRLSFDKTEKAAIMADFGKMVDFIEKLNELNTENIEPLIHVNPVKNNLRADEITEHLSQADALKNAPDHDSFYFKVPKVVDGSDSK